MPLNRRQFLAAAGGIGVFGGPLVGKTRAADLTVKGIIETPVETSFNQTAVQVYRTGTGEEPSIRTNVDSDGHFSGTVPETGTYTVIFFDRTPYGEFNPSSNNLPVAYVLGTADVEGDETALGTFSLPKAHRVEIKIVSETGEPMEDFPVNFRFESGHGLTPGKFTTNAEGYVKHAGASETGVDLVGQVVLEKQPLSNPDNEERLTVLNITESSEIEISVTGETNDETNSTVQESTEDQSQQSNTRGFFTNDETDDGPLSNVMNLTVMGFVLSVGGIMYQLFEGR